MTPSPTESPQRMNIILIRVIKVTIGLNCLFVSSHRVSFVHIGTVLVPQTHRGSSRSTSGPILARWHSYSFETETRLVGAYLVHLSAAALVSSAYKMAAQAVLDLADRFMDQIQLTIRPSKHNHLYFRCHETSWQDSPCYEVLKMLSSSTAKVLARPVMHEGFSGGGVGQQCSSRPFLKCDPEISRFPQEYGWPPPPDLRFLFLYSSHSEQSRHLHPSRRAASDWECLKYEPPCLPVRSIGRDLLMTRHNTRRRGLS